MKVLVPSASQPQQTQVAAGSASRLGRYQVSPDVMRGLQVASRATGVGFGSLAATAAIESSFQESVRAPVGSATGLFQFIEQTWFETVRDHGHKHGLATEAAAVVRRGARFDVDDPILRQKILSLRSNPEIASRMGAEHLGELSVRLAPSLGGRSPDAAELYLGHFLGASGAGRILRSLRDDPKATAASLLPQAADMNPKLFRSPEGRDLAVSEFVGRIRDRISRVYAELGLEAPNGQSLAAVGRGANAPLREVRPEGEGGVAWGVSDPAKHQSAAERLMLSALAEVFTRMEKNDRQDMKPETLPGYAQALPGSRSVKVPAALAMALSAPEPVNSPVPNEWTSSARRE